jgi:hypothetical protein
VGGDRLDYSAETATSTVDITTFKILINSKLSTKDANMMMMMDIKNYYFGTPLPAYEYMFLQKSILPDEIIKKYHLTNLEIQKGMYGLNQAGILTNQLL